MVKVVVVFLILLDIVDLCVIRTRIRTCLVMVVIVNSGEISGSIL